MRIVNGNMGAYYHAYGRPNRIRQTAQEESMAAGAKRQSIGEEEGCPKKGGTIVSGHLGNTPSRNHHDDNRWQKAKGLARRGAGAEDIKQPDARQFETTS